MLPIASVKLRAAHEPVRSMPSGFGSPCAIISAPATATNTTTALILDHTAASSSHPAVNAGPSPSCGARARLPCGSVRVFPELRRDDVRRFEVHRVVDHGGPDDDVPPVRLLE